MHPFRLGSVMPAWTACLAAALLLAGAEARAQGGGASGQSRAARSHRPALPEGRNLAPLQPEPGDIWAEVRSWYGGPRRGSPAAAEAVPAARRPATTLPQQETTRPAPGRRGAAAPAGCKPDSKSRACR